MNMAYERRTVHSRVRTAFVLIGAARGLRDALVTNPRDIST